MIKIGRIFVLSFLLAHLFSNPSVEYQKQVNQNQLFSVTVQTEKDVDSIEISSTTIITRGRSTSQSISIINGNTTIKRSYIFNVSCSELGTNEFYLSFNGEKLGPYNVVVSKSQTSGINFGSENREIFVTNIISKSNPFVNQVITLSTYVYFRVNLNGISFIKENETKNFTKETIDGGKQLAAQNVNGVTYQVYLVQTKVLTPLNSGKKEIAGGILRIRRVGNIFYSPVADFQLNSIKLNVRPLPEDADGLPVGNFNLSVKGDFNKVKQYHPISFKIELSGDGNLKMVSIPDVKVDKEFFDYKRGKSTQDIGADNKGYTGKITTEVYLIPQKYGRVSLPNIDFTYIDYNGKKQKKSFKFPLLNIQKSVDNRKVIWGLDENNQTPKEIKENLRFLKTSLTPVEKWHILWQLHLILLSILAIQFLSLFIVLLRKKGDKGNYRLEKDSLKQIKKMQTKRNSKIESQVIEKIIQDYLRKKYQLQSGESFKELEQRLNDEEQNKESVLDLIKIIKELQSFHLGGRTFTEENQKEQLDKISKNFQNII